MVFEVRNILWNVLSTIYLKASTELQWLQIAKDYNHLWQLPNCLGNIDGKHVRIQAPSHSGAIIFNYKKILYYYFIGNL